MILLGDQSPWAGGLVRWLALKKLGIHEIVYCQQDADTPWKQEGDRVKVRVKRGWPHYWSLACRYPFSPSIPGLTLPHIRDTVKAPSGLQYLQGGNTARTIAAENTSPNGAVNGMLIDMLREEKQWAATVARFIGSTDGSRIEISARTPLEIAQTLADALMLGKVESLVELFGDSPPKTVGELPPQCFWSIDEDGIREEYQGFARPRDRIVPKGIALPLEVAARGWQLGFSSLGYLEKVTALRDRYLPGLEIQAVRIGFRWHIGADPVSAFVEYYLERKKRRREEPAVPDEQSIDKIRRYWAGRPTAISYLVLKGELNPTLEYVVL